MTKLGDRIKDERIKRGLSQDALGELVGYKQGTISEIEKGKSASPRSWRRLANTLEIPEDEFREMMLEATRETGKTTRLPASVRSAIKTVDVDTGKPFPTTAARGEPNARVTGPVEPPDPGGVPIYGRACGGEDGKYEFNGEVIGWEPRPSNLRGVPGVYGVYIDGESMYPRYKPGETAVAQPGRPVARGDDVIVQIHPNEEHETSYGFVKEFVAYTPTKLILTQHNPRIEIEIDRDEVVSVHRIVHADR